MDTKQKTRRSVPKAKPEAPPKAKSAASPKHRRPRKVATVQATTRKARTAAPQTKRTRPATNQTVASPEVIYTPAMPFNRNRLLLQLATVVAVVLAMTFGMSIFFKVENVTVSGAEKYDAWTVMEASGIQKGDNLLSFGKAKACGRITTALPYVESVRIGIKLPDTVNIEISELDVVYAAKDGADNWWLITSEGKVIEQVDSATAGEYTKINGVQLDAPVTGETAVALEPQPETSPTDDTTEAPLFTVPVTVTARDRLNTALTILQCLEDNGIIGAAASVDVMDLGNLELWYGQQYQVMLGDNTDLTYKIRCMNSAINGENGLKEYDSGILDVSFTLKEDQIVYKSFD